MCTLLDTLFQIVPAWKSWAAGQHTSPAQGQFWPRDADGQQWCPDRHCCPWRRATLGQQAASGCSLTLRLRAKHQPCRNCSNARNRHPNYKGWVDSCRQQQPSLPSLKPSHLFSAPGSQRAVIPAPVLLKMCAGSDQWTAPITAYCMCQESHGKCILFPFLFPITNQLQVM